MLTDINRSLLPDRPTLLRYLLYVEVEQFLGSLLQDLLQIQ